MSARSNVNLAGVLAVFAAAALWGTSGIFVRLIVTSENVTPFALAFWRDLFTFIVLLAVTALLRPASLRVQRRDLPWLAALGGSLGVFHVAWNLGVLTNGAAVATVQQAAMPAIVAVAARLLWREALTWNKILAIMLTFTGTMLVTDLDVLGQSARMPFIHGRRLSALTLPGLLVGLAVPFTYACWNLFAKKVRERCSSLTTWVYAFGFSALVLFPFQFFTSQPWPVSPIVCLWFAGLVSLSTALPFPIYAFGLGRLPASVATILVMTEIPIVSVYAYFLLGERMSPDQILGAALVVAGVLLLSWRRMRNDE
ncbi:MAG: DMT family transporter [Chloroflexota bacterium]|nr:DMT family transporter [Chloroflexota bacterium]